METVKLSPEAWLAAARAEAMLGPAEFVEGCDHVAGFPISPE